MKKIIIAMLTAIALSANAHIDNMCVKVYENSIKVGIYTNGACRFK